MVGGSCRFGPFLVDRAGYAVTRDGVSVELTPKLIDLLLYLVDRPATLVTKEELLDALWPDANVTDNALAQAVSELRQALGDEAASPKFIRTIPRRGYRFVATVEAVGTTEAGDAIEVADQKSPAAPGSLRAIVWARETPSLDAHRAFLEGSLRLESLDVRDMPRAREDFERAVSLDPRYALAYTGLSSAEFAMYEATRCDNEPAQPLLDRSIEHARYAVELEDGLAEAHAALALPLVSAWHTREAIVAARRAVALEPSNWRHFFRLGHASWGDARLEAAAQTRTLYPEFAFTHFQVAMVHVARGHLAQAESVLREGVAGQERQAGRERFPAQGLHWLLGLVLLAEDRASEAVEEFNRELELVDLDRLYGREYAIHSHFGRGTAFLRLDDVDEASVAFRHAIDLYPEHAPSRLGLACCLRATGESSKADAELRTIEAAIATLSRRRPFEADTVRAQLSVARDRPDEAVGSLQGMLTGAPPGFAGWTLPIEPLFRQLAGHKGFTGVLGHLAERAR